MKRISKVTLVVLFALLSVALGAQAAFAAEIVVTTNADGAVSNNGACTLREAITNANTDSTSGSTDCAAGSGADTIVFTPTLTSGGDVEITLDQFDTGLDTTEFGPTALYISSQITIKGPTGSNGVTIQRSSTDSNKFRLFHVTSAGNLTLENLTLKNGLAQGGNGGNATTGNDRNTGGGAAGLGGAIYNQGTLVIRSSTLTANSAVGGNGGSKASGGTNEGTGGGGVGASAFGVNGGGPNGGTAGCTSAAGFGGGGGGRTGGGSNNGCAGGFGGGGGGSKGSNSSGGTGGFGGGGGGASSNGTAGASTFGGGTGGVRSQGGTGGGGLGAGGAIFNITGTVTISNSTLSSNSAQGGNGGGSFGSNAVNTGNGGNAHGAAVFNRNGTVTIVNSTLANNALIVGFGGTETGSGISGSAGTADGGALYNYQSDGTATTTLHNTILANTSSGNDAVNNSGTINGTTSNIVESSTGLGGVIASTDDPGLGALQDNGGPTWTQAIGPGSVALDVAAANANCPSFDQRGIPRPLNTNCDIGAYELEDTAKINSSFTGAITSKIFNGTPDGTYPAYSAQGITTLTTRFTNTTASTITSVYLKVKTITSDKYVLDANGGPGQVGAVQFLSASMGTGVGASTNFRIAHALVKGNFAFVVDVWGKLPVVAAGAESQDIYLGSIEFVVEQGDEQPAAATQNRIFLPTISR